MPRDVQIRPNERVELHLGDKIPVPVRDYEMLVHKPMLNGVELIGNFILKLSDLENDVGYISQETDPTVPAWAKQPNKPVYTAEEIGAMSNTVVIPVRVSQLENDSGYYIKPVGGIPLSDFAPGVIPDFSSKIDMSMKGARGGVAELDQNGMVPSHQLPSYVDDVKSYPSISFFPTIGEDDKIYIDKSTNKQYRWSGDMEVGYVPITSSIALGETAQTAYRGDRGKIAYDHAMMKGQAFENGLYKITTNAEGHVVLAVSVTKEDITALGIPGDMPDVSDKADKYDTVLESTLSCGRAYGSNTGYGSIAFGGQCIASSQYTQAFGFYSQATGPRAFCINDTNAANGADTFAGGYLSEANGFLTFVFGHGLQAELENQFVIGKFNVPEYMSDTDYPLWIHDHDYAAGSKVRVGDGTYTEYYIAKRATHTYDEWINFGDWERVTTGKYIEIVGNGSDSSNRSNAYALGWDGTGYFAGDVYVGCDSDSTRGDKLITISDVPVIDVQVDGVSVVQNRIANIAIASSLNQKYEKPASGIPASDLASDVISDISGKISAPVSASSGDFLVFNGTSWVAQSLQTWQGGNY